MNHQNNDDKHTPVQVQNTSKAHEKHDNEENFHDEWAESESISCLDVRKLNEACTAPEIRHINKILHPLTGKDLLDLGCGLGEAGVYFACKGARVTAVDISHNMLMKCQELARNNGVEISVVKSSVDKLTLPDSRRFDVVYAGNLFHHVDIEQTLKSTIACMKKESVLVSWDPVAYNPLINIYRKIATKVRTSQEHPLKLKDIDVFKTNFEDVTLKWFWLTTQIIFIIMVLFQRRNPNKERLWKKVVIEEKQWKWIYIPLEFLDKILLKVFPFLRLLCWNVVIHARNPRSP